MSYDSVKKVSPFEDLCPQVFSAAHTRAFNLTPVDVAAIRDAGALRAALGPLSGG